MTYLDWRCHHWFPTKEMAEEFAINKLATTVDLNTKAVESLFLI